MPFQSCRINPFRLIHIYLPFFNHFRIDNKDRLYRAFRLPHIIDIIMVYRRMHRNIRHNARFALCLIHVSFHNKCFFPKNMAIKKLLYLVMIILSSNPAYAQAFSILSCPDTSNKAVLIVIFTLFSLFLVLLGVLTRIGFIGLFGSLFLLVLSLYIYPCINIIGSIMLFLSILLMFMFIFRSSFGNSR